MTLINWDGPYYYIDPSEFSITPAGVTPTAGEEAVPTYGLNGGPGWTQGPRIKVYDPMLGADFGKITAPEPCLTEQKTRLQSRPKTCRRDKHA